MAILTEGRHAGEFVLSVGNGNISFDTGTIASGQGVLKAGTVLTKDGSNYIAANASATAGAVLFDNIDATSAAVQATLVTRDAEVIAAALTGLVTAHRAQLASSGVVVR